MIENLTTSGRWCLPWQGDYAFSWRVGAVIVCPITSFKGGAPSTENEWDHGGGVLDRLYIYIDIVNLYSVLWITVFRNVTL
jgi:hypothetical protein